MLHNLDAWLWRRGITHPVIRPVLRVQLLLVACALPLGGLLYIFSPWFVWFGVGLSVMALIFWSWARFFLRGSIGPFSTAFLGAVLFRWGGRMLVLAGALYVVLVICKAPPSALLSGLAVGAAVGWLSFALAAREQ